MALLVASDGLAFIVGVDLIPLMSVFGASMIVALEYATRVPKWLVLMGAISYEMYFTHFVVLAALERTPALALFQTTWGGLPFFLLVVILAALFAYVVRWGISTPGARLIRRLSKGVSA